MSEATDFRISVGLPDHPKWLAMREQCGPDGQVGLITLWAWARAHRPNGDLSGVGPQAVEAAARWRGKKGRFHAAILELHFLDADGTLHGWTKHNGWATGSAARSHVGRVGAIVKWCLRRGLTPTRWFEIQGGDAAMLPDVQRAYEKSISRKMPKASSESIMPKAGRKGNPPYPTPTPSPSPTPKEGGDGLAAARPPSPDGSGAAPPEAGGGRCACGGVAQRSDPRGRCFACIVAGSGPLASRSPAEPAAAAPEAPERGYAVPPHVVGCSPRRQSWRTVGRPGPRRRWPLDDED